MSTTFSVVTPVKAARKAKRCAWCGELCPIAQPRVRVSGTWEGDFFSNAYHPECHAASGEWWAMPANRGDYEGPEQGCMRRGSTEPKHAD